MVNRNGIHIIIEQAVLLCLELEQMKQDPCPGIQCEPLDASCFFWQGYLHVMKTN